MPKLTKAEIEKIKTLLDEHGELPRELRWVLFPPERQEAELVYAGKRREEDIFADVMSVPLQPMRSFGEQSSGWQNRLIFGDNLQALRALCDDPEVVGKVNLIYIDPPFATLREFRGSQDQKAYQDKIEGAAFVEFIRKRLVLLKELLHPEGAVYIHLDTKKAHYIKIALDELFGESNFRNEIVWKRQSAHNDSNKCGAIHDSILFYSNSGKWTWNEILTNPSPDYVEQFFDQIEPETNRRYARGDLTAGGLSGGRFEYEYKGVKRVWRAPRETMERYDAEGKLHWPQEGVPRIKRYLDEFEGVPLQDIWNDIRVIHNRSSERVDYPTQKPETLLERIITASSNRGDLVLDAFAGSGTTCAVAEKLGRRWIGIDCGKLSIYTIQKRILNLREGIGQKGKAHKPQPFTLYHAGLYDFASLKELDWEGWRFFALRLFECKDRPHKIGSLQVDGERRGSPVLVFNWKAHPDEVISEETIDDIHAAIGDKVGRRFYIIAPMLAFDFFPEYLDRDGVRYYALRIPYQFINELHSRDFQAVLQARDADEVNDTQEAYGFSFIVPPDVEFEVGLEAQKADMFDYAYIKTTEFISHARIKGNERDIGMEGLAMLLVDLDFDGSVFNMSRAFFAHQLEEQGRVAVINPDQIGRQIMAVWVDYHGNEFKAVIKREDFGLEPLTESKAINEIGKKRRRRAEIASRDDAVEA